MNVTKLTLGILSIVIITTFLIWLSPFSSFKADRAPEQKEDEPDLAAQQNFELTKDPVLGRPTPEILPPISRKIKNQRNQPGSFQHPWIERGPNNIAGRTRAFLIDSRDPSGNAAWVGAVGGGLWKTTNLKSPQPLWTPINDFFKNIAITWLAQDPSNPRNLYFSTGEGYYNADAIRGLGIWKSADGGISWDQLPSTDNYVFYYVLKVVVNQSGAIFAATGSGGLQLSRDGGSTWERVQVGANLDDSDLKRISDVELDGEGNVYVSTGFFSAQKGKVFRLHEADLDLWTEITPDPQYFNRIEIAIAPSNPKRLYLLCEGDDNNVSHIFRSDDRGVTWINGSVPTIVDRGLDPVFTRKQAWYDLIAQVDPNNEDNIYIGGVDALKSKDGGATWQQISVWTLGQQEIAAGFSNEQYVHADHHGIYFMSGSSSDAVWVTDGGVFFTSNLHQSVPSFIGKNMGYNVTQFYACAIHPEPGSNYFLAGSQDNGTQRFSGPGLVNTAPVTGGDGGYCFIDQDQPNIQISSFTKNSYNITTNNWSSQRTLLRDRDNGSFINPSAYDSDQNVLYTYKDFFSLYRVSATQSPTPKIDTLSIDFGTKVTHLSVYPNVGNGSVLYVGTAGSELIRVDGAESNSYQISNLSSPDFAGSVSCIAFGKSGNDLALTFSNYNVISVWLSRDGGQSWRSIEGDLPNFPVRWALFNPNNDSQLMLATEMGIWFCPDVDQESPKWATSNNGLANTRIDMLQLRASDKTVIAASHGRGLFSSDGFQEIEVPCNIVNNVLVDSIGFTSAHLTWTAGAEELYNLRYRMIGDSAWIEENSVDREIILTGLTPCRQYEFQIQTKCQDSESDFSSSTTFFTQGCADAYCSLFGDGKDGWIESFTFQMVTNQSGNNHGYHYFDQLNLESYPGQTININLETMQLNGTYQISIFLDLNQNQSWESDELIGGTTTLQNEESFLIIVPDHTLIGYSRLRVSISQSTIADPCDGQVFDVEDYLISINTAPLLMAIPNDINLPAQIGYGFTNLMSNQSWVISNKPNWIQIINPTSGSGFHSITFAFAENPLPVSRQGIIEFSSPLVTTSINLLQDGKPPASELMDLIPQVISSAGSTGLLDDYHFQYTVGEAIVTNIRNESTWLSQGFHQGQMPAPTTSQLEVQMLDFLISPNPVKNNLFVDLRDQYDGPIYLINLEGKVLLTQDSPRSSFTLSTSDLLPGLYFILLEKDGRIYGFEKFVKH